MKLIEALKKRKDLKRKFEDLVKKIGQYCVYYDHEKSTYKDQPKQVQEWMQACTDILKEISKLSVGIQKTNLSIQIEIELGDKKVSKSIYEWIIRRQELVEMEARIYSSMSDKGLKSGFMKNTSDETIKVELIRCYSPEERDRKLELLSEEPSLIDSRLEIVNAITDIIEE